MFHRRIPRLRPPYPPSTEKEQKDARRDGMMMRWKEGEGGGEIRSAQLPSEAANERKSLRMVLSNLRIAVAERRVTEKKMWCTSY